MHEWNAETIRKRAADVRASAKVDEDRATLRKQFAVTLEDIANAWAKDQKTGDATEPPQPWLMWGNKVKCPYCGKVKDYRSHYCPECGKETKE